MFICSMYWIVVRNHIATINFKLDIKRTLDSAYYISIIILQHIYM